MTVVLTLLGLAGFVILTAGTALFVAAEFSLTALERSTVDANARRGGRRDSYVQRAHRTLSFQLSGAQVGISITLLITGYLAEPLLARLLLPALKALASFPSLFLPLSDVVSMVFGELVPKNLASPVRCDRRAAAGPQCVLDAAHPAHPLTNGTANWILRRLGIEPAENSGRRAPHRSSRRWCATRPATAP